jgi:hypothetical protein
MVGELLMTIRREDGYWPRDAARIRDRAGNWAKIGVQAVFGAVRARTRPTRAHIVEHGYTWTGFGLISAASFVHSVFAGLLVMGILALVFEWKVGGDDDK